MAGLLVLLAPLTLALFIVWMEALESAVVPPNPTKQSSAGGENDVTDNVSDEEPGSSAY